MQRALTMQRGNVQIGLQGQGAQLGTEFQRAAAASCYRTSANLSASGIEDMYPQRVQRTTRNKSDDKEETKPEAWPCAAFPMQIGRLFRLGLGCQQTKLLGLQSCRQF
jgi:hypothetical protein